jgi:signal transduction histidine kinase
VAINQRPIRLTDYPGHPRALFELSEAGVKYQVGAPILAAQAGLTGETCLGSLLVLRLQDKEPFDDRNLALLESIAYQAGAAIQNARLYAALHERETILEAATYAANAFISHANWRIVIEGVLQQLGQVTGASHISLFELLTQSDETSVIIRRYMWSAPGIDSPAPADAYLSPGLGDAKEVETPLERNGWERWRRNLSRGLPFYGTLLTLLPNEAEEASRLGVQSLLCVPVFVGDSWWGEIRLDDQHTMRQWSLSEIDGLKIVAGVLGSAIQRQHSDQARLENEALYRRTISAAGAVPYVTRANDDQFAFIGEGIFKLTGFTNQEMDLNLWNERIIDGIMMGEAEGLSIDEAWEMARKGKLDTWNCDYLIRHRDGSLRWISDTSLEDLGPDGKWRGSTGIMMDITDRKQAEEVIRRLNAGLEERVRQRTSQLEFSNRELEAANQELEAFAYSVAHDLRAPLRSIDGYSKLLAEDYSPSLPDEARQYLDNTRRAAQRMGQLIDDLLLLSRVTRAEMHIAPVNLSGIALDVIGDLRRQDPQRAVMVTIEPELNTDGDASLLRLALENLLGNAWKFTSRQEQPSIYLGKKIRKEETVFFIKDNGAGFDMKYAHQLFKAFQRLHSIEEFKGSGVGLATVQRVIQRHGGHIWAKATVGEGAVFYFTIKTKV